MRCSSLNLYTSSQVNPNAKEDCVLSNEMEARRRHIQRNCKVMRKGSLHSDLDSSNMFTEFKSTSPKEVPNMDTARLYALKYRFEIHHNLSIK